MPFRRRLVAALVTAVTLAIAGPPAPVAAADPVIVGAGDIAGCSYSADSATARLLDGIPGTVVTFGDNAYDSGTRTQFRDCYGPTWGRHKARTRPSPGNHDYRTSGASGYFGYFGTRTGPAGKGWYSYDLGAWHIVVLNSNCTAVGCGSTSPQVAWLRADLAAHPDSHVLAYWHHPRFSSGTHGGSGSVAAFWRVLHAAGADIVLNGHDHDYERFGPQDPNGLADPEYGIRQFVVGTGGVRLRSRAEHAENGQAFSSTHGVLKLTLGADSYAWEFVPVAGRSYRDSGTDQPHGRPPARRTTTFMASGDAYVDQAHPRTVYGTSPRLLIDGDTGAGRDRHAYVKVRVSGSSGPVERAVLRLWVTGGTRDGPAVYPTTTRWSGRTLTWANRPGPSGPLLADVRSVRSGGWVDFDVTGLVSGDGTYAFLVRPTSGDGLGASSMQGTHPPRLIIRTRTP